MNAVTTLFDGETGLDGVGRPGGDDLEHSGTSQDDGMCFVLSQLVFQASRDMIGRAYRIAG